MERIAGQIASGERTLAEVQATIQGIAAGLTEASVSATSQPVSATTQPAPVTTLPVPATTQPVPTTTQPVPTTAQPVPTTVVVSGGVLVGAGESIQAKVDAYPGGTLFVIGAGVHRGQEVRPKAGDTFVGEPGAVLDGGGTARWAFAAGVPNVTIRGLVVQNYATPSREGVIQWLAGGNSWLVEGNEVRDNAEIGIRASSGWRVVDNYVHDNGRYGITGGGSGLVVEGNEIAHNAVVYGATGDSSGTKFAHTVGLVLRDNYVHDNFGNGLWVDINNLDVLIEGNRSVGNTRQGIFYEISCAGVIRNNHVEGNGFDGSNPSTLIRNGILVSNSSNVEVYGNTVVNNANGIGLIHWDHGNRGAVTRCEPSLKNVKVHDNTIVQQVGGAAGLDAKINRDKAWTSWGNRFSNNTYTLSPGVQFRWETSWVSYQQWKNNGQN